MFKQPITDMKSIYYKIIFTDLKYTRLPYHFYPKYRNIIIKKIIWVHYL